MNSVTLLLLSLLIIISPHLLCINGFPTTGEPFITSPTTTDDGQQTDQTNPEIVTELILEESTASPLNQDANQMTVDQNKGGLRNVPISDNKGEVKEEEEEDMTSTIEPIEGMSSPSPNNETNSVPPDSNNGLTTMSTPSDGQQNEEGGNGVILEGTIKRRSQAEVLNELRSLWYFSEALDDQTLKSSLNSLVHLAYARVYTEPDSTLYRLKQLLQQLRSELNTERSEEEVEEMDELDMQTFSRTPRRVRRDIGFEDALLMTDNGHSDHNNELEVIGFGIGEEVKPNDVNALEKSDFEYFDATSPDSPLTQPSSSRDAIVHKVIKVKDRIYFPIIRKKTTFTPVWSNTDNSIEAETPLRDSEEYLHFYSKKPSKKDQIKKNKTKIKDKYPQTPVTPEDISNTIIKLLYPALMNMSSGMTTPTNLKKKVGNKGTTYNPPINLRNKKKGPLKNNQSLITSSLIIPYPTLVQLNDPSKYTEDIISTTPAYYDFFYPEDFEEDENEEAASDQNPITVKTPLLVQLMEDINTIANSSVILNRTTEGVTKFLTSFDRLSPPARTILTFTFSTSIVCIVLGIYSSAPPITAVGVMGLLIPIFLLFLFQNPNFGKLKSNGKRGRNDLSLIRMELADSIDQVVRTVDIINSAFKKYSSKPEIL